jgi:hypothetical protein
MLRACGNDCIVEWKREIKSGRWESIGNNETDRVYSGSQTPVLVFIYLC